jgi:polyhydroxyalkanoate synthesis regulator phasin
MREMLEEMVDELLDMEGDVVIGNLTFSRSQIVKELDPIAYREMLNDMADSHIEDLKSDLEFLQDSDIDGEHYDEIDDLKSRIRELEGI